MDSKNDLLTSDDIVLNLNAKTKEEAIEKLSVLMKENGIVSDYKKFFEDVEKREKMTTTGMGNNIAIPHGKSPVVNRPAVVFAKNLIPLEWNSLDGSKVTIIFLMAVPESNGNQEHLHMLAKLSEKLIDVKLIKDLQKETDKNKIIRLLTN